MPLTTPKGQSIGYYAYVHIRNMDSTTVIQYWLFYAYNNGQLNDHQSDIEVIEVFLDGGGSPTQSLLRLPHRRREPSDLLHEHHQGLIAGDENRCDAKIREHRHWGQHHQNRPAG